MNKRKDWELSSQGLRKTLKEVEERHYDRRARTRYSQVANYKFGAVLNRRYGYWQIWNAVAGNVIATIKYDDRNIVRYRPNSHYAPLIRSRTWREKMHLIPSENLHRHRGYARNAVHDGVRQELARARTNDSREEVVPTTGCISVEYNAPQNELRFEIQQGSNLHQTMHDFNELARQLHINGTDLAEEMMRNIVTFFEGAYYGQAGFIVIPRQRYLDAQTENMGGLHDTLYQLGQEFRQEYVTTDEPMQNFQVNRDNLNTVRSEWGTWTPGNNPFSITTDNVTGGTDVQQD